MPRLLYLTTWDFGDGPSTGITNKIKAQMKAFAHNGFSVDYTYLADNMVHVCQDSISSPLGKVGKLRKLAGNYYLYKRLKREKYAYVYNRYGLMDPFYLKLLKALYKNGARIIVEMPTYPYEQERLKGLSWWLLYTVDKLYCKYMKKYVYRLVSYSRHEEIFGIPVVQIKNGVDFERIKERDPDEASDGIHLIAVAGVAVWHGYDRLLTGMGEYYRQGGKEKIYFHLVGDGEPVRDYKRIVREYGLEKHVAFYGMKYGAELDDIYDQCDIGVEALGWHRTNVTLSSSLKSKEYAAKGLPLITGCTLDAMNEEYFVHHVPYDESPVDMTDVTAFYRNIYDGHSKKTVADDIRRLAEGQCSIEETIKPIIECFSHEEG